MPKNALNLEAIRARLAGMQGKQYWRSLDELAATDEFQEFLHREFPRQASEWVDPDPVSRRSFLKLMGASLALAGLTGCSAGEAINYTWQDQQKIIPYVDKPEELIPGVPLFYATAMPLNGYAIGLLARSNEGRPTKVEGNPSHPASLGATDLFAQASTLTLYDPDRSRGFTNAGQGTSWNVFLTAIAPEIQKQQANGGAALRIISETVTSPTLISQMAALQKAFPQLKWYQYDPSSGHGARAGAQLAFGQPVNTMYHFDQANVVFSLDSNFLQFAPGRVRYARDMIGTRVVREGRKTMSRVYVVESTPSITGANADHRLPVRASDVAAVAGAVAKALGVNVGSLPTTPPASVPAPWIAALVKDLQANQGKSVVIAGEDQPAAVHAMAHAINDALKNVGTTVTYTAPIEANPGDQIAGLRELTADMASGKVDMLVIMGGNPVYNAPADLKFADAMAQVRVRVRLGLYNDETTAAEQWFLPEAHYLESWSDARAFDGSATVIQQLIDPLYGGKTAHEVVAALLGQNTTSKEIVRAYWLDQYAKPGGMAQAADFTTAWKIALNKGVIDGSAAAPITPTLNANFAGQLPAPAAAAQALEITFRLDPTIWDGRFANNGWLQEAPKPLTSLTWDNVAMVSPTTAQQRGLANGNLVQLSYKGRTVQAPVWVQVGQPDDSVGVQLGYGRNNVGVVGGNIGYNAYSLMTSDAPGFGTGLELTKLGGQYDLSTTQSHFSMEGRDIVRVATLEEFLKEPKLGHEEEQLPSLYNGFKYEGNAWGMSIDTTACIGCNSCVIACQSENNIPIVGKADVARSREMHWLKIDTYFGGKNINNPETYFQPRMCVHCENAPCEVVCPVAATVHDHEGLNSMVYNRCVGTRYCSNNCPYKVRRFNYLQYSHREIPVLQLVANPEVTVRNRGVMEKCTYCVQRINVARIASDRENRPIADGEIVTACQQACPTDAIVFGNINDANSRVAKLKAEEGAYGLLAELNTRPRTSHLPRVRNPNPEIEE